MRRNSADLEKATEGRLRPHLWTGVSSLRRVLLPSARYVIINDCTGAPLHSAQARRRRWTEHFRSTWNVHTTVAEALLQTVPEAVADLSLDEIPTFDEVVDARAIHVPVLAVAVRGYPHLP